MALSDARLYELAERLVAVPGVAGVLLGGSRARGTHTPDSDTDLGLYYRPPLDVAALNALAREVAGPHAKVTAPGEWGPWVDGGGWLTVDGAAVDWIYRDLDRVARAAEEAERGRYAFHTQAGHPLGVADFAYAGEVALGVILADPSGELAALRARTRTVPPALREALVKGLWEADFLIGVARKAVSRGDSAYVAGCLFRIVGVCAHALHGAAGRWLVNEKGAVAAAAALPGAPERFRERVDALFARVAADPLQLSAALDAATDLILETADACAMMSR
ncbi:nucleotidyltransferase domain-containing protein [Couchioplanes caeruleus]|uniref:DNA polymerase subunit beta n=2 Tax=Couchioplanes caeruleus TaxID=56438 RepID=A0A1K0FJB9_9ACTN|nr:nucleotidyltransferase domain-containing protein [Couchioplanes caeruleus]OJF12959.1 DNA polymerase subunit beta [Couchioplanes caeruleus subsp. caeruleus]ROP31983.1 nucleotidyltransferase-like protein [Couchioplanes caeruleus]